MARARRSPVTNEPGLVARRKRPTGPKLELHVTLTAEAGKRVMRARTEGPELRTHSDVIEDLVLGGLDGNGRSRRPGAAGPIDTGDGAV